MECVSASVRIKKTPHPIDAACGGGGMMAFDWAGDVAPNVFYTLLNADVNNLYVSLDKPGAPEKPNV